MGVPLFCLFVWLVGCLLICLFVYPSINCGGAKLSTEGKVVIQYPELRLQPPLYLTHAHSTITFSPLYYYPHDYILILLFSPPPPPPLFFLSTVYLCICIHTVSILCTSPKVALSIEILLSRFFFIKFVIFFLLSAF